MEWEPISEKELSELAAKETRPEVQRLLAEISRLRAIMKLNGWKVDFSPSDTRPEK
ncbi:MAG: hypothetical protein ACJ8FY_02775 [Gemmataceae bacterium]